MSQLPPSNPSPILIPNQADNTLVDTLVEGYIQHFYKADQAIEWTDSEREIIHWLNPDTVLIGKVDRIGITDEQRFFLDDKTQNPPPKYKREEWKAIWGMNPQSLTYGVLVDSIYPGTRRFCIRKSFKSIPPSYDFAWFAYSTSELQMWRSELQNIADEIRSRREGPAPWMPNFLNCFRYGVKYACPFYANSCSKLDWNNTEGLVAKEPHLDCEQEMEDKVRQNPNLVILGATRVEDYMSCPEKHRRIWEEGVTAPEADAQATGKDFHHILDRYYQLNHIKNDSK
jgi:hypothetical protein